MWRSHTVIPAAFSSRESGEGIQCLSERHWVPAFAGTTGSVAKPLRIAVALH
jgi:hypothetical protein